jgi:uncharacterized phage protein gp47/JayE
MDLPSRLDLFTLGKRFVSARARRIDPAKIDTLGSDVNLIVGSTSVMADHVVKQLGYSINRLFLEGAEDEDLDRWGFDRYQEAGVRKGAAPARTSLTISRPTTAAGAGDVPVGTRVSTLTGIEYVTTTAATLAAADLFVSGVFARAAQAGKLNQVGAEELRRFAQPDLLFDATLTVINEAAAAGGEDDENDDLFKARLRAFWRAARRGTLGAIEFGALTVGGVVSASAVEALTVGGLPARVVDLYIADSSGVASDALAADVDATLREYRAGGIAVIIHTSLPQIVTVELRLSFQANVDTLTLTTTIRAAVVGLINSLPVNGTLYRADLFSLLRRYVDDGLVQNEGTLVSPTGDLVPEIGQTIRTELSQVTVVI